MIDMVGEIGWGNWLGKLVGGGNYKIQQLVGEIIKWLGKLVGEMIDMLKPFQ